MHDAPSGESTRQQYGKQSAQLPLDVDSLLADEDLAKRQAAFDICDLKVRGELGEWVVLSLARVQAISRADLLSRARRSPAVHGAACSRLHAVRADALLRALYMLASCLPVSHAPDARRRDSQLIAILFGRQPHAFRAPPDDLKIPETPPANIARIHFGRCHRPTVSLRLTPGHRGRKSSEQSDRLPIPYRNQQMPTRFY